MFAYNLMNCLIKYSITVDSQVFIGGALEKLDKQKLQNSKSRGKDYQLSRKSSNQKLSGNDDSGIDLSIFYPVLNENKEVWEFLIPGSTLKGLFRNYCYNLIEDILDDEKIHIQGVWNKNNCLGNILIRQTFGTTDQKGIAEFYSAEIKNPYYNNKAYYSNIANIDNKDISLTPKRNIPLRLITQNKLDRISMATTEGLRALGTIEKEIVFAGQIELHNFPWWSAGLLCLGIAGFNNDEIRIGAKSGIGFGKINFNIDEVALAYHKKAMKFLTEENNYVKLPGIGSTITSFQSKFEYIKASKEKVPKDSIGIPLFLLSDNDYIQLQINKNINKNPFYENILKVDNINDFFYKTKNKVKETLLYLTGGEQ
ncbi:MAG: hypothetical protein HY934_00255 [Candidatus Firestonebacteria bacterium]|nr:hypothetical protein [Candidatus Firestonebacteria bacterium]